MIFVLHGDDTASSYQRLSQIQDQYKTFQKITLPQGTKEEEIILELSSFDLLNSQKLIIVESYLAPLKKLPKFLANIPSDTILVFWEKSDLSPTKSQNLAKIAKVEYFKAKSDIFPFLDTIVPNSKGAIQSLARLSDEKSLLWHLQNRLLLLILYKRNIDPQVAEKIIKRKIFDWQWNKIKFQSEKFNPQTLLHLYTGALKIDFLIKTGKTSLPPTTLISMLLFKHLK